MSRFSRFAAIIVLGSAGLGACATKSDIQQLQADIAMSKAELGRRDSVRAAQLGEVIRMQRVMYESLLGMHDSLLTTNRAVAALKGGLSNDLYDLRQQLMQVQELTGQSQRRLTELRVQLEAARETQAQAQTQAQAPPADTAAAAAPVNTPSAQEMYQASLVQLRAPGRTVTARSGFQEMLRLYPTSELAPDALYFIGLSFAADTISGSLDSAGVYYQGVVDQYPTSVRAPGALYNLGLLAERRKDGAKARGMYQRIIKDYPKSDEVGLARERLDKLKAPRP